MISKFYEKTDLPLVVKISYIEQGELIICAPTNAFKCFMGTEMNILTVGPNPFIKEGGETLKENYERRYDLD